MEFNFNTLSLHVPVLIQDFRACWTFHGKLGSFFGEELLSLLPKPKPEDGIFWFLIQITNCTQNICTFFVEFVNPVLIVPCIKYALQSCQHLKHKDFQFPVIA